MKSVQRIISVVTVKPAPMKGKATTGSPNTPLHTGFGLTHHPPAHSISTWTIVAGIGVIASLLLGAALFFVKPATSVE